MASSKRGHERTGKERTASGRRAGEVHRDEQRAGGPRYGDEGWSAADRRQAGERFGGARNDDAEPLEQISQVGNNDDDVSPRAADPDVEKAEKDRMVTGGGEHEGFGRGEKPRKPKQRAKKRSQANTKTKKRHR